MSNEKSIADNKEKSSVGARVNKQIVDIYKAKEIPVSLVIEASMIHFLKLSDEEKITFLSDNLPENTNADEFEVPSKKWGDILEDYLNRFNVPSSLSAGLLTGIAIGAVGLIGGLLSSKLINKR